jgi:RimJ/RimL family protein N-acetyltransferase
VVARAAAIGHCVHVGTVAKTPDPTHSTPEPLGNSRRPPAHEAAPSPAEPPQIERVTMRDGRVLVLREIYAGDVLALQRGFARLSPDEVRMRFLHPLTELPHDFAVRLTHLEPKTSVAFVFIDLPDEPAREIRGVARAYVDATTLSAEFAIVVQRQYTGQGLGVRLMHCLIDACRLRGAEELWGDVFIDNVPMLHLLSKLGFRRGQMPHDPGVQRMVLRL